MDDKGIIDLYFDRSEKAISETAVKYGKYCFSIAFNILTDKEDSEESVNDTWLAAWNTDGNPAEPISEAVGKWSLHWTSWMSAYPPVKVQRNPSREKNYCGLSTGSWVTCRKQNGISLFADTGI